MKHEAHAATSVIGEDASGNRVDARITPSIGEPSMPRTSALASLVEPPANPGGLPSPPPGAAWDAQAGANTSAARSAYVRDVLEKQNADLPETDREYKFSKMEESSIKYMRAANAVAGRDFASNVGNDSYGQKPSDQVIINGDMHAFNYAVVQPAGGKASLSVFDFDDATKGPYTYDVDRTAMSLVMIGRANGFSAEQQKATVDAFTNGYMGTVQKAAANPDLQFEPITAENGSPLVRKAMEGSDPAKDRKRFLDKLAPMGEDGERRMVVSKDFVPLPEQEVERTRDALQSQYRSSVVNATSLPESEFSLTDVRKAPHFGVGSLGMDIRLALTEGTGANKDEQRVLIFKEQIDPLPGTLTRDAIPTSEADSLPENHGKRASTGLRAMQMGAADPLVGYANIGDKPYMVYEMQPGFKELPLEKGVSAEDLSKTAAQMGEILAVAHVRNDQVPGTNIGHNFEQSVVQDWQAGKAESFQSRVLNRAVSYADQVEVDYQAFKAGREQERAGG